MNQIDLSQLGGFPLDEDALDFMQQAYLSAIRGMFIDAGASPVIISGMVPDYTSGLQLTPGAFYYNGEFYTFPGGSVGGAGLPPTTYCLNIAVSSTPALFESGVTHNVFITAEGALTLSAPDATNIAYSTFKTWQEMFGRRARNIGIPFDVITVASGLLAGSIYYKKNVLTNTLHIRGNLSVNVQNISTPHDPPYYYNGVGLGFPALAAAFRPANDVPFKCLVRYHTLQVFEATSKDYILDINAELNAAGEFGFGIIRPATATTYDITFNQIIPLD